MSEVGKIQEELYKRAESNPGLYWSQEENQLITRADRYLNIASEAFDTRQTEPSNREWKTQEYSLKLKDILDVLLDVSNEQLEIPDKTENKPETWKLKNTNIALTKIKSDGNLESYKFTTETINDLDRMARFNPNHSTKAGRKSRRNWSTSIFHTITYRLISLLSRRDSST